MMFDCDGVVVVMSSGLPSLRQTRTVAVGGLADAKFAKAELHRLGVVQRNEVGLDGKDDAGCAGAVSLDVDVLLDRAAREAAQVEGENDRAALAGRETFVVDAGNGVPAGGRGVTDRHRLRAAF